MRNDHAQAETAAVVGGRELAEGNAGPHHSGRTRSRAALSHAVDRVRQAAQERGNRVTALGQQVDSIDRLREAYDRLHHEAAPGVEGQTEATYGEPLDTNLRDLADRLKRGAYQAPPVERVDIPTAEGRQRPIGTPTREDKIGQRATVEVLNAIYEPACLGGSSGAGPGRSPPPAGAAVTVGSEKRHSNGGLAADIRGVYDARDPAWVVKCIEHRMGDQRVGRHLRQGRKAGVREEGHWRPQAEGTPQGGRASPLLATLYLHEVVALWAAQWRRRPARGDVLIVRYGDEFSVGFPHKDDAEQCLSDLRERFPRFSLARHPEKTRLSECGRGASERRQRRGQGNPATFDVRGLTPRGSTTTRGKVTGRRCPIAKRLRKQLQEGTQTRRARMHWPIEKLGAWRTRVVVGHYRSYGVPRNMGRLRVFREGRPRDWGRS
jgi:RNA-directed DNA polymerase